MMNRVGQTENMVTEKPVSLWCHQTSDKSKPNELDGKASIHLRSVIYANVQRGQANTI